MTPQAANIKATNAVARKLPQAFTEQCSTDQ